MRQWSMQQVVASGIPNGVVALPILHTIPSRIRSAICSECGADASCSEMSLSSSANWCERMFCRSGVVCGCTEGVGV